jgi:NTE family protein
MLREKHDVRHAINELHKLLPPEIASTDQAKRLYEYGCVTEMDIVQLIYRPKRLDTRTSTHELAKAL